VTCDRLEETSFVIPKENRELLIENYCALHYVRNVLPISIRYLQIWHSIESNLIKNNSDLTNLKKRKLEKW